MVTSNSARFDATLPIGSVDCGVVSVKQVESCGKAVYQVWVKSHPRCFTRKSLAIRYAKRCAASLYGHLAKGALAVNLSQSGEIMAYCRIVGSIDLSRGVKVKGVGRDASTGVWFANPAQLQLAK